MSIASSIPLTPLLTLATTRIEAKFAVYDAIVMTRKSWNLGATPAGGSESEDARLGFQVNRTLCNLKLRAQKKIAEHQDVPERHDLGRHRACGEHRSSRHEGSEAEV
eukprot:1076870-Rhodomonas_salina.1